MSTFTYGAGKEHIVAILNTPQNRRTRLTFYFSPQQALTLKKFKKEAHSLGLTLRLKDEFVMWICQQLTQMDNTLKTQVKKEEAHD